MREHLALRAAKSRSETAASIGQRFAVRSGQQTSFVAPDEIDWIEADGNYAILHVGERHHLLRQSGRPAFLPPLQNGARVGLTVRVRELQERLRALSPASGG